MLSLLSLKTSGFYFLASSPVLIPNDFELAIPGPVGLFKVLLVVSFLVHIIFVNIIVASSTLAVIQEGLGIYTRNKIYDRLAEQLATHTSILKSIAVVMGVAPLLLISVIYNQFFYPSTILIGKAWLSLIVLLIVAFLLLYAYKFTWKCLENHKPLHLLLGASGALILLFVPLIFIVNIVSMLYPDRWADAQGFFHALIYYPQVWQRYFHFVLASFAVTGMFIYWWNHRQLKQKDMQTEVNEELANLGKKFGTQLALWTSAAQLLFGTLVLLSLDRPVLLLYIGDDPLLTFLLIFSILATLLLVLFLFLLWKQDTNKWFTLSLVTFTLIVVLMAWMRHEVREEYIKPYLADTNQIEQAMDSRK